MLGRGDRKVVWDINRTPVDSNEKFQKVVARARELLRGQPGHELAHQSTYAVLALQASKMAGNLAEMRNAIGGGHGRARKPYVRAEEVDLALDGALTWVRWALRRPDLFAEDRPDQLIRDLIGSDTEPQQFFTQRPFGSPARLGQPAAARTEMAASPGRRCRAAVCRRHIRGEQ